MHACVETEENELFSRSACQNSLQSAIRYTERKDLFVTSAQTFELTADVLMPEVLEYQLLAAIVWGGVTGVAINGQPASGGSL